MYYPLREDGTQYEGIMEKLVAMPDPDIQMATTIRASLLSIVAAIEKRYELPNSRNSCAKRKDAV